MIKYEEKVAMRRQKQEKYLIRIRQYSKHIDDVGKYLYHLFDVLINQLINLELFVSVCGKIRTLKR